MNIIAKTWRTVQRISPPCAKQDDTIQYWLGKKIKTRCLLAVTDHGKWITARRNPAQHITQMPVGTELVVSHVEWSGGRYHLMTHSTPISELGNRPTDISILWTTDGALRGQLAGVVPFRKGERSPALGECQCPVCMGIVSLWVILLMGIAVFFVSKKWWMGLLALVVSYGVGWWLTRKPFHMLDVENG